MTVASARSSDTTTGTVYTTLGNAPRGTYWMGASACPVRMSNASGSVCALNSCDAVRLKNPPSPWL